MKIEIILLGVILVIILFDLFLKRKKKKKDVYELVKDDIKNNRDHLSTKNNLLYWKKSIGLIIFSTIISKPLITYVFYEKYDDWNEKYEPLNWYFNKIFEYENTAFLISFLFVMSAFYFLKDSRLSLNQNKSSSRIRKLESLYKDGIITEEEYKSKKEEIRKDSLNDI